jgi:hypothetical protein
VSLHAWLAAAGLFCLLDWAFVLRIHSTGPLEPALAMLEVVLAVVTATGAGLLLEIAFGFGPRRLPGSLLPSIALGCGLVYVLPFLYSLSTGGYLSAELHRGPLKIELLAQNVWIHSGVSGWIIGGMALYLVVAAGTSVLVWRKSACGLRSWSARVPPLAPAGILVCGLLLASAEHRLTHSWETPFIAEAQDRARLVKLPLLRTPTAFLGRPLRRIRMRATPPALPQPSGTPVHVSDRGRLILLFIIETARASYFDQETTPSLMDLRKEALWSPMSFTAAVATLNSWQALFNGDFAEPYAASAEVREALPLKILFDAGYRIDHFSVQQIANECEGQQCFYGRNHRLVQGVHAVDAWAPLADQATARAVNRTLDELRDWRRERHLLIVHLQSTHNPYWWPPSFPPRFLPIISETFNIALFSAPDTEWPGLRNRYRNALHYVDSLFGSIVSELKRLGMYRDAVILVAGDHGEEFFEKGGFAHSGGTLVDERIRVPIYLKLPGIRARPMNDRVFSNTNLLPTLLDYLRVEHPLRPSIRGASLLSDSPLNRQAVVVLNRGNAVLVTPRFKIQFWHDGQSLFVKSISNLVDKPFVPGDGSREAYIEFQERELLPALDRVWYFERD